MAKDTVDQEEEYFHRQDKEKLRKLKEAAEAERAAKERAELKDLHWLRCGKCGQQMNTQLFKGVEIEICPDCGSVLLDPGELEQLVGKDGSGAISNIAEFFSFTRRKG